MVHYLQVLKYSAHWKGRRSDPVEVEAVSPPKKRTKQAAKKTVVANKPSASKKNQRVKVKDLYDQTIFRDWCKACGICIAFCPKEVIGYDKAGRPVVERPDDCIGCRFCEFHCPDFAITIEERDAEQGRNQT
jgi:2-oxoglutarate ferredoxin oxidoreductase subunit delta